MVRNGESINARIKVAANSKEVFHYCSTECRPFRGIRLRKYLDYALSLVSDFAKTQIEALWSSTDSVQTNFRDAL